jgi:hypothetical protein
LGFRFLLKLTQGTTGDFFFKLVSSVSTREGSVHDIIRRTTQDR